MLARSSRALYCHPRNKGVGRAYERVHAALHLTGESRADGTTGRAAAVGLAALDVGSIAEVTSGRNWIGEGRGDEGGHGEGRGDELHVGKHLEWFRAVGSDETGVVDCWRSGCGSLEDGC